jgi:hypothetical protein
MMPFECASSIEEADCMGMMRPTTEKLSDDRGLWHSDMGCFAGVSTSRALYPCRTSASSSGSCELVMTAVLLISLRILPSTKLITKTAFIRHRVIAIKLCTSTRLALQKDCRKYASSKHARHGNE